MPEDLTSKAITFSDFFFQSTPYNNVIKNKTSSSGYPVPAGTGCKPCGVAWLVPRMMFFAASEGARKGTGRKEGIQTAKGANILSADKLSCCGSWQYNTRLLGRNSLSDLTTIQYSHTIVPAVA